MNEETLNKEFEQFWEENKPPLTGAYSEGGFHLKALRSTAELAFKTGFASAATQVMDKLGK